MISRDYAFGHRDPWTGEIAENPNNDTSWDMALFSAYALYESVTDGDGTPMHYLDDPHVGWRAVVKTNKKQEAIDKYTSNKSYKRKPGQFVTAEPYLTGATQWPTIDQWFKQRAEKDKPWSPPNADSTVEEQYPEQGTAMTKWAAPDPGQSFGRNHEGSSK